MNWQQVTQSFLPLSREQTMPFASPREMDLAIAAYNRAIRNIGQDSADMALIALRKLASDHPRFHEASLLYGCCLARLGALEEAREQLVATRQLAGLPSDLSDAADAALRMVEADMAIAARQPNGRSAYTDPLAEQLATVDLPSGTAPAVLERTGRRKRVQMASERERREIIRRGEMAQPEETHVVVPRSPVEIIQSVLPVALIVIAAGLVVFLGIRFLPGLLNSTGRNETQERLDYLLTQLERRAPQDPELQALLSEYSQHFNATPQTTAAPTAQAGAPAVTQTGSAQSTVNQLTGIGATASDATTVPTLGSPSETQPAVTSSTETTPAATTPIETQPGVTQPAATQPGATTPSAGQSAETAALMEAHARYQEALAAQSTDRVLAAERFLEAEKLLETVPPETAVSGLEMNAGQLRSAARQQLDSGLARNAALDLRDQAQAQFDRDQYAAALPIYLRAYALNPASYGGGVAYYCGRCHQLLGQPEQARPYYEYVVEAFDGRDIARSAAVRLRELDR